MPEMIDYPFEFSVVMAVYNVEPFLRETVNSLIRLYSVTTAKRPAGICGQTE